MDTITVIFSIFILIVSVIFHELSHGFMADQLGDPTARMAGRLTLNPLAHLDWMGSVVLPILCIISGSGFMIGWAKPVPFYPNNLRNRRWGPALVAFAGPLTNIILAIIAAGVFRILGAQLPSAFAGMMIMIVSINISLAVFNLIPVPPLDGHHILGAVFPAYQRWSQKVMSQYGIILVVVVLLLAGSFIWPIASLVIRALLGA